MGNTQTKSFLNKQNIILCCGVLLAFVTYLVIIIPGLNNSPKVNVNMTNMKMTMNIGM
jgi:hypothetical protein